MLKTLPENLPPKKKRKKLPKVKCDRCQTPITFSQLKQHQGTKNCRNNYLKVRQKESLKDYVKYDQYDEVAQLVNLGAIPEGKMIAQQFTAYVPRWIADAHQTFRRSRGYAGMDFLEFLDKLRGTHGQENFPKAD